jgi:hypothetical protein
MTESDGGTAGGEEPSLDAESETDSELKDYGSEDPEGPTMSTEDGD